MGKVSLLDVVPTKNEAENAAAAAGRQFNTITYDTTIGLSAAKRGDQVNMSLKPVNPKP